MIGINGKDLNEYLISAKWENGIILTFTSESYPYVRTNEIVTIAGKSFLVVKCTIVEDNIIAIVRGKKFELNHFKRINKCLD
jgi:hypothetical protein